MAEVVAAEAAAVWDLTDIYPSQEAWDQARNEVLAGLEAIHHQRGTLGDSADSLYQALALISDTRRKAMRVFTYASLKADENLRDTTAQEQRQLAETMYARLIEATSWVQPEILEVGEETIESYIREDERLQRFAFDLDNSLRNAPHTLGEEAEATLAYFSQTFGAPENIYSMVANSDIPWTGVIDSQGYSRFRSSENRDDRKKVFDAFWGTWNEYRNSVGAVLNAHIQTQVALSKARKYDSVLQRELFEDNLPEAVYRTLVTQVNRALPTLHRYFRLRKEMLGLDEMRYYDTYPPLAKLDRTFDIETSKAITLEAMSVLGEEWVERQREAMNQRWMHVYPQRGKPAAEPQRRLLLAVHAGA